MENKIENQSELIIYKTDDGAADVKLYSKDGIIWMSQQQMALLLTPLSNFYISEITILSYFNFLIRNSKFPS